MGKRRCMGVVLLLVMIVSPSWGGRGSGGKALENELLGHGVARDTRAVIEAALGHDDEGVRLLAISLLGERGDPRAIAPLQRILEHAEQRLVREQAALALAALGDPEIGAALRDLNAQADDPGRRLTLAGQRATLLGDTDGYVYAIEAAGSDDPQLRYMSVGHLVRFAVAAPDLEASPTPPSVLIRNLMSDDEASVRQAVLIELSVGFDRGLPYEPYRAAVLAMTESDPDSKVREQAKQFLLMWDARDRGGDQ